MPSVTPLSWSRTGRSSVRRASDADRIPVEALAGSPGWREAACSDRTPDRIGRGAPPDIRTVVVEVDAQISGAALLRPGRLETALGRQPWEQLSEPPRLRRTADPPCETLLVDRLGWSENRAPADSVEARLVDGLLRLCQQLGARRVVVPLVLAPSRHRHVDRLGEDAYLQQVHFRGVDPPAFAPFFERGFELRGRFEPESIRHGSDRNAHSRAVLAWDNSRI